jgi:N-acetylneuraminic acid mutarotase
MISVPWSSGKPMPTPGYGFACAAVGKLVFAIGGEKSSGGFSNLRSAVEAYDVEADSWEKGFGPAPMPRAFAGCAALGNRIYVIGGYDGVNEYRRVDRFDPQARHWDTVAPLPAPRMALGACVLGGLIYAVGGYNNNRDQRTVYCFHPDSGLGQWEAVDSLSIPRLNLGVAADSGYVYAVGGLYASFDLNTVEQYRSAANEWTTLDSTMGVPRSALSAVGYDHYVCAIGGSHNGLLLSDSDVVVYDAAGDSWVSVDNLLHPREFLGAAVADDTMIVVMGGLGEGGATLAYVERHPIWRYLPVGIEESPPAPKTEEPLAASVVRGRISVGGGAGRHAGLPLRLIRVFDNSGHLIRAQTGSIDVAVPPGIYFVRIETNDHAILTDKVVVVK